MRATLLLFEGLLWTLTFSLDFEGKIHYLDVFIPCFSEKLPAAGNLAFIFRGQWQHMKWITFFLSDAEGRSNNSVCKISSWYDKIHKKCMLTLKCQDEGKGQKNLDTRTFINSNFQILMYFHKTVIYQENKSRIIRRKIESYAMS
jgi:hypothetical protein